MDYPKPRCENTPKREILKKAFDKRQSKARMEDEIRSVRTEKNFDFNNLNRFFELITPFEEKTRNIITISDYILREGFAPNELFSIIHCVQLAVKSISGKVRRYNINEIGESSKAMTDNQDKESKKAYRDNFVKKLEDIFINVVGNSGLVRYMISKHTEDIIQITGEILGNYMMCFNVLDKSRNLQDHLPVGSVFGLYKLNEEKDLDLKDVMGDNLVISGYALYGTSTMLVMAFNDQGVHSFYLDESLGEFILSETHKRIDKRGITYAIDEGITVGWDDATKIFVNRKKDPRLSEKPRSFYIGSISCDISRIISMGGIYMDPANIKYPNGKLNLLCEANPVAYVLRQAGGYASDGFVPILALEANGPHEQTPFFGGSIENVINIMELKNIYKAKDRK